MVKRLVLLGLAACIALAGCDAATLDWRITFADAADRADARRLRAEVRRGGCDGELVYEIEVDRGEGASMAPPTLPAGTYGVRAEAYDADCAVIAEACVVVELPRDEAVVVELASADGRDGCEGACVDGRCEACAGGACDADGGIDAGGMDAGPGADGGTDAGVDAGTDASAPLDAGSDAGLDAGPMLAAPAVVAPWSGVATGSAIAPIGSGSALLADPPLTPELRWRAVPGAVSYLAELVRCDARDPRTCDFGTPTARIVADDRTFRGRPSSPLPVETATAPLGARYAFRVGACAEAAGRGCTFAPARALEVGRVRQDVDGDGRGDLFLVGRNGGGTHELRRAATSGSGTTMVAGANRIHAVGWVGDYDGDGIGELAMGTDGAAGGRLVFFDEVVEAGAVDETTPGAGFGDSVVGLDDVDGDGYADFAVNAVGEGEVRVFLGGPTFDGARRVVIAAPTGVTEFGASISGVGDRDGDGLADLAVAARTGTDTARVYVYSLAGRVPSEVARHMMSTGEVAATSEPRLPINLAGGVDMDDDGVPEILVGRPVLNSVVVLFATFEDSFMLSGEAGRSVALGDVDGTGVGRAIVGGPSFTDPSFGMDGTSWHVLRDAGDFLAVRIVFVNFSGVSRFGQEVSVVDVDGNGREDPVSLDGTGDAVHVSFYDPDRMAINALGRSYFASGVSWVHVAR